MRQRNCLVGQSGGPTTAINASLAGVIDQCQKFRKEVREEFLQEGIEVTEKQVNELAECRVRKEINRGVQMIQYQVITLMTTNGQAPFVTVFMYLNEVPEGQTKEDLASIIFTVGRYLLTIFAAIKN